MAATMPGYKYRPAPGGQAVRFTGKMAQYFGIWAFSFTLCVFSLGIYMVQAGGRLRRYMWGSIEIESQRLRFREDLGRTYFFATFFLACSIAAFVTLSIDAIIGGGILAGLFLVWPVIVTRALRARIGALSWAGIPFEYRGIYDERASLAFAIMPLLAIASAGLLLPLATQIWHEYVLNRIYFGKARFRIRLSLPVLYQDFIRIAGYAWGTALLLIGPQLAALFLADLSPQAQNGLYGGIALAVLILLITARAAWRAFVLNHVLQSLICHRQVFFAGNYSPRHFVSLALGNLIGILLSGGLAVPWARFRTHAALCAGMRIEAPGEIGELVQDLNIARQQNTGQDDTDAQDNIERLRAARRSGREHHP